MLKLTFEASNVNTHTMHAWHKMLYSIRRIIGKHYIWRFAQKTLLVGF